MKTRMSMVAALVILLARCVQADTLAQAKQGALDAEGYYIAAINNASDAYAGAVTAQDAYFDVTTGNEWLPSQPPFYWDQAKKNQYNSAYMSMQSLYSQAGGYAVAGDNAWNSGTTWASSAADMWDNALGYEAVYWWWRGQLYDPNGNAEHALDAAKANYHYARDDWNAATPLFYTAASNYDACSSALVGATYYANVCHSLLGY